MTAKAVLTWVNWEEWAYVGEWWRNWRKLKLALK